MIQQAPESETTVKLREVLGVMGPHDSEIEDSDERENIAEAVERGYVRRESLAAADDFVRVIEYEVPGSDGTRYAVHREQGDGLTYIHDSINLAAVESAYEQAVRELAETCDYKFTATDVKGAPLNDSDE